jgi:hypothetical protein
MLGRAHAVEARQAHFEEPRPHPEAPDDLFEVAAVAPHLRGEEIDRVQLFDRGGRGEHFTIEEVR